MTKAISHSVRHAQVPGTWACFSRVDHLALAAALLAPLVPQAASHAQASAATRAAAPRASRTEPRAPLPAPPPISREFRGVWVVSVNNGDWPSRPGLPAWQQQTELLAILDRAAALRLNAVVLQVRPAFDALYASPYEPWSEYLTGQMGRAPEPRWDPLAFAVAEAHRRGLELHAWFNPYRARHKSHVGEPASTHVSRTNPALAHEYDGYVWMDPGEPAVRRATVRVLTDVARRYDVDGIHIDDYFYPYPTTDSLTRERRDFPDSASWNRYRGAGGTLARDDWRRRNVDQLIRQLGDSIHAAKPWVKFGVSPFGIWRPGYPAQIKGFDAYSLLYADARNWLQRGWVDYLTPQLYWATTDTAHAYGALLDWWLAQNTRGRHLWPGNNIGRVGGRPPNAWPVAEVLEQIRLTRTAPGATGNVLFSMGPLLRNREGLADSLVGGPYAEPALVPRTPWLRGAPPAPAPAARVVRDPVTGDVVLTLAPRAAARSKARSPWLWTVRVLGADGAWRSEVLPGATRTRVLGGAGDQVPQRVVVTAVDRLGKEGTAVEAVPQARAPIRVRKEQPPR